MKDEFKNRINKLWNKMKENKCDGVIINKNFDVRYLTGFNGRNDDACLLITDNDLLFFTDSRFYNQFEKEVEGFKLIKCEYKVDTFKNINNQIQNLKLKNILISFDDISIKSFKDLGLDINNIKNLGSIMQEIRRQKNEEEIMYTRKACQINEEAFKELLNYMKEGISEIEIRNILNNELNKLGSERNAFETIIASGKENGALPHAVPTERKVQKGDLVTIDFGAVYKGYKADNTRTIAIGEISDELKNIYNIVLKAKNECEEMVKPGVSTISVHQHAQKIINDNGYELPHGLGHGIGLATHELPLLNNVYDSEFKVGDIHSIEPGIYVPGVGGVRIEDDYLVTKDGVENLTPNITTDLITI